MLRTYSAVVPLAGLAEGLRLEVGNNVIRLFLVIFNATFIGDKVAF